MNINVDDIKEFHLDSAASVVMLETLEISHSLWPTPIRIVTNHADGVTVTLENDQTAFFEFAPLLIKRGATSDDLDQSLSITLGDLGEIVPPLIKQIREANSDEKPQVTYRSYAFEVKGTLGRQLHHILIGEGSKRSERGQDEALNGVTVPSRSAAPFIPEGAVIRV